MVVYTASGLVLIKTKAALFLNKKRKEKYCPFRLCIHLPVSISEKSVFSID